MSVFLVMFGAPLVSILLNIANSYKKRPKRRRFFCDNKLLTTWVELCGDFQEEKYLNGAIAKSYVNILW